MQHWEMLSNDALESVHRAACRVLEAQGLRILHAEAAKILADAGARRVDDSIVRFPRELVEAAIAAAPPRFTVYDRRGGALEIGGSRHCHLNAGTMTEVLDYPAWTRRPATLADVRDLTRLIDALAHIDMAVPIVEGMDAPPGQGEIMSCAEMLKQTTKFCWACPAEGRAAAAFVRMAKALAGSDDLSARPFVGLLGTILPGYKLAPESAETMILAAREGLPVILMGGGANGIQSPATMAGSFVMKIAEALAALCLVQAIRPGSPCLIDMSGMKLDMRTMEIEAAGPESPLSFAAGAQLARRYGVPSYACPMSDAKIPDLQAGFEMTQGLLAALLAGIDVTVNAGATGKATAASAELLVLHDEMLRDLQRLHRGMVVDEERLAVEAQLAAGFDHDYLADPLTFRYLRDDDEMLYKELFDATGVRAAYDDPCRRAHDRVRLLLDEHRPAIDAAALRAVDAVVADLALGK